MIVYLQLSFRQTFDEMNTNKRGKSKVRNQIGNFSFTSILYKTVFNAERTRPVFPTDQGTKLLYKPSLVGLLIYNYTVLRSWNTCNDPRTFFAVQNNIVPDRINRNHQYIYFQLPALVCGYRSSWLSVIALFTDRTKPLTIENEIQNLIID